MTTDNEICKINADWMKSAIPGSNQRSAQDQLDRLKGSVEHRRRELLNLLDQFEFDVRENPTLHSQSTVERFAFIRKLVDQLNKRHLQGLGTHWFNDLLGSAIDLVRSVQTQDDFRTYTNQDLLRTLNTMCNIDSGKQEDD